jgi:hypothetical protein
MMEVKVRLFDKENMSSLKTDFHEWKCKWLLMGSIIFLACC